MSFEDKNFLSSTAEKIESSKRTCSSGLLCSSKKFANRAYQVQPRPFQPDRPTRQAYQPRPTLAYRSTRQAYEPRPTRQAYQPRSTQPYIPARQFFHSRPTLSHRPNKFC